MLGFGGLPALPPLLALFAGLVFLRLAVGRGPSDDAENQGEHSEYERLDQPHEKLQQIHEVQKYERQQEYHDQEQHLPSEDVAEETKSETDQARRLSNELQDTQ